MIYIDRDSEKARRLWAECMLISIVAEVDSKKYYFAGTVQMIGMLEFRREVRAALAAVRSRNAKEPDEDRTR